MVTKLWSRRVVECSRNRADYPAKRPVCSKCRPVDDGADSIKRE